MSSRPLISIIIPIFNSQYTLERCISSVINQTYTNWELFLIDDGSKDGSWGICKTYADLDSRIHAFTKENGGVSSARNVGLKKVRGEYLTFIDSDDYVKERFLDDMIDCFNDNRIDLVSSYADIITDSTSKPERYAAVCISDDNFEDMFIYNDMHWHTSPWGKLYKTDIIKKNDLRFCEGMHIGEDALFLFSYMLLCDKIFITNTTEYCYFAYNTGSLTKRINTIESELLSYRNISNITNRIITEKHINSDIALKNLVWLKCSYQKRVLNSLYYNKSRRKERIDIIKGFDWKDYTKTINDSPQDIILNKLITHKLFYTYDFLRHIRSSMKSLRIRH